MKLLHKQLAYGAVLLGVLFGSFAYLYYDGMDTVKNNLAAQSTYYLAKVMQPLLNSELGQIGASGRLPPDKASRLRTRLRTILSAHDKHVIVEELAVLDSNYRLLFGLNPGFTPDPKYMSAAGQSAAGAQILIRRRDRDRYDSFWALGDGKLAVLTTNPTNAIREQLHSLNVKIYLIGFTGLLGVIFFSLLSTRFLKAPLKQIETAMQNIDNRKYGFRITAPPRHEFSPAYQKVNQALSRMEHLDSVQRNAVQRKNVLVREISTLSRFLDIMAHEIKNPMHALVINLDVLKTKLEQSDAKTGALKHARILDKELNHLQEVVQGFLKYVRPGVPRKERIKINAVIKDVCQMAAAEAKKSKVKLETRLANGLKDVMIDQAQFQQALHNIIINAIHASQDDGKINIRSWSSRNKIMISVKDAGHGIPKAQLKRIFDLYYTTKKTGTGLGLPISKRIVEVNGGQLQIDSKLEKGTTVTILLPTK